MAATILVVDEHPVVCSGIADELAKARYRVTIANASQALRVACQLRPGLVVLESRMGEKDGLRLVCRLRDKAAVRQAIVFSEFDNPTFIARSVALGVFDYVLKSASVSSLILSIRNLEGGIEPAPESLFGQMKTHLHEEPKPIHLLPEMTTREYQVLRHLGFGLSNREIGSSLGISVETIKEHVQNILRKLNVRDRTAAAVKSVRTGVA